MSAVLTTAELAKRWRTSERTIRADWRNGHIPPPLNPHQSKWYRWSLVAIEQFERGEWQPKDGAA